MVNIPVLPPRFEGSLSEFFQVSIRKVTYRGITHFVSDLRYGKLGGEQQMASLAEADGPDQHAGRLVRQGLYLAIDLTATHG